MRENHNSIHCAKDAKFPIFPSLQDKHNASYHFLTCQEMAFTKSAPKVHKIIEYTIAFWENLRFMPKCHIFAILSHYLCRTFRNFEKGLLNRNELATEPVWKERRFGTQRD